jgi:VIT1/CCC1 family predicted Fe2+/Mn2+ transporter
MGSVTDEHTTRQDENQRRGTFAERRWTPQQRASIQALLLTLAIVIAPFLALLFGLTAALVVLAIGLGLTAWLCWQASRQGGRASRGRLRALAALNGVLALVCLVFVAMRL